jgi:hypothetical protein
MNERKVPGSEIPLLNVRDVGGKGQSTARDSFG